MDNYSRIIEYALRLISGKRYTCHEMEKKLQGFIQRHKKRLQEQGSDSDFPEEVMIHRVMARLRELRYLDDEDFARDYIAQRVKIRPRGAYLMRRELKMKGIKEEVIEEKLGAAEIDEEEMAQRLLEKKFKKWEKLSDFERKNKAYQFLAGKGFQKDAIYKAVDSLYNHSDL